MLRSPKRTGSSRAPDQKTDWLWRTGRRQLMNQHGRKRRHQEDSALQERRSGRETNPELCVEGIEVSADKTYMYCKGCVRSRGTRSGSQVVVAVEWLDGNRKALNTDWKRIGMHLDGKSAPLLPDGRQPFTVRAPLDRRVKWVQAYAFCGDG